MDITIDCEAFSVEGARGGKGGRMLRLTLSNIDADDLKQIDDDILDAIGRERAIEYFEIVEAAS